jgi:iron complex transport system substrate-binding protein
MALSKVTAIAVVVLVVIAGFGGYLVGSLTAKPVQVVAPTTRVITDMTGRNVTIPTTINRVLTTGPVEMELVYMIAPAKLAGLSFSYNGAPSTGEAFPPFVPLNMTGLPIVGGWFGTQKGNFETFIGDRPDIIIDAQEDNAISVATLQQDFGSIPVVELTPTWADNVTTYAAAITFVGNLLGVQVQAQKLVTYYNSAMQYAQSVLSQIPVSNRARVYYAEGSNGLSTDPLGSMHTQLLALCGGINVANVTLLPGYGMASVSPEQILLWNPSIIIIGRGSQASLYHTVMSNTTWSSITAVANGKVYVRPDNPFSWFDGPPGPMQIVGIYWMVHLLYPAQTSGLDLSGQVETFYSEFIHYSLNSTQVASLLAGGPS